MIIIEHRLGEETEIYCYKSYTICDVIYVLGRCTIIKKFIVYLGNKIIKNHS